MDTRSTHLDVDREAGTQARMAVLDACLAVGLLLLLMFAVLAFGATQTWSSFVLEAGAAALFVLWAVRQAAEGSITLEKNPLLIPLAVLGVLVTLQAFTRLSAYPFASRMEWMRYAAYGMLFLVSQHLFRRHRWRERVATAMATFGAVVAVLGIAQDLTAGGRIYWRVVAPESGTTYGPYVYHGAYAGLMEMLAPLALCLALDRWRNGGQRLLLAFGGILMAGTIFLSRSRGGMIAFSVEIAVLAVLLARREAGSHAAGKIAAATVAIAILVGTLGSAQLARQVQSLRTPFNARINGDRITIAKDALRMFRDRPLAGWGLDVFPIAYPHYRSFSTTYFINEAHNDYAQLLVETGAIGALAMLAFIVLLYRVALANLRAQDTSARLLTLAALTGCTGLLVHGVSDFNFHVPANAAMFMVLAAMATAQSGRRRDRGESRFSSDARTPFVDVSSSMMN